jgi:hypothetical protein
MLDVECHLMRGQRNLSAALDDLQLGHDKKPMWERQQAVGDAKVDP